MTSGEVGSQPHAVTGCVEPAEVAWRLGRSRVPVVTALSLYLFLVLREGELALYRGSVDSLEPILLVAPVGEDSAHESRAMSGMTLVLEDPGGEAATQYLRKERVAGIPGPLAASVMKRLATTAEEHPWDVLVPDPQQLAVTIGPMFRTNPQVRSRLLVFLAVLQSDPDEAAPDPHHNRPSRAPHERVQVALGWGRDLPDRRVFVPQVGQQVDVPGHFAQRTPDGHVAHPPMPIPTPQAV